MFYYLYKITNWYNGMIYIGVHSTVNLEDGYMGSGTALNIDKRTFGLEYFTKDILAFFDSPEEMLEAESAIVNEHFVNQSWSYNLTLGGIASVGYNFKRKIENDPEFRKLHSDRVKQQHRNGKFGSAVGGKRQKGKPLSEEHKNKLKFAQKHGSEHHLYGTCLIHNDEQLASKRIQKSDLETWLQQGWEKGGKIYLSEHERSEWSAKRNLGRKHMFNPQTGEGKMIRQEEIETWLSKGWKLGRHKNS